MGIKASVAAFSIAIVAGLASPAFSQPKAGATFSSLPTVTIAHWRNNATAAYSLVHDDACDGFKGPPARGTFGLFDHWPEAAARGLVVGLGAIGSECLWPPETLTFLKDAKRAGYELFSHSWFHCDHTQPPAQCLVWSDAANGGEGGMVPVPEAYPELNLDTREKLVDYEMQQSRALLEDEAFTGASVRFYAFPFDAFDSLALSRLSSAGYIGARGGDRSLGNINAWHINPDPGAGGDESIDFRVRWDEYNFDDVPGSVQNISDYDPPSLTNYLEDIVSGGLGGWGMQVLHGISDLSFGTVALDVYQAHLDAVRALSDQGTLWVANPTEVIKYRRTNYHCGVSRDGADAVVGIDANGVLTFAGLADPGCAAYATEVTLVVTLPAGVDAITATQNGNPLRVRAGATPGQVLVDVNPVLGTATLQPAAVAQAPAITSAATTTFTVGSPGTFTVTATGNPAPTFSVAGTLAPGISLHAATGVISGVPAMAGSFVRTISASNGVGPDAVQSFTLVVGKGNQAIAFAPIAGLNVGEVDSIAATATSGLAVTFASATPGVCTVSNTNLTVTGVAAGSCTIEAAQGGNANWNAAPTATLGFAVTANQVITFGPAPELTDGGGVATVTATASSGLAVELTSWIPEICTIAGNQVTGHAVGDCIIAANQAGNDFYHPASQVTQTIKVVSQARLDSDKDGVPNSVEPAEGLDPAVKDNDVFASARLFAMQQYRDFLDREGDPAGIAFWAGQIQGGGKTRAECVASFFDSAEFQGTVAPIARLYFAYFQRVPDYDGLQFWIGYYKSGHALDEVSGHFAASAEFQVASGPLTNSQFVTLVYDNVLGRAPDPAGLAFWVNQLDTGARTRGQVMLEFSESAEHRSTSLHRIFVTMMYAGMLRRSPDPGGFAYWVAYLDAGNPGLALIGGFLASGEYHRRFLP